MDPYFDMSNLPPTIPGEPQLKRLKAFSRYFNANYEYEWRPCDVLAFDETERNFLILWHVLDEELEAKETPAQKAAKRLKQKKIAR